tara:strand:- start:9199 stop:12531 length:3333 start_codon:yes stop_codon:yes gene_type:complete
MFKKEKLKSNTQAMQIDPQGFQDNMSVAFYDFAQYHNSMSAMETDIAATSAMINDFNEKFPDADIPQVDVYRPDLPLTEFERREMEIKSMSYSSSPEEAILNADITHFEKKKFVQNKIQKYLSKIPPQEREKYNGFNFFFEKEAEKARQSAANLSLVNQYAENGFDRIAGTLVGGMGAGFTDPLILSTIPFGFAYGSGFSFTTNLLRVTAAEAVIAFGATTAIEASVLPFKESVGIEYTVEDAAKVVLLSTLLGASIPSVFAGTGVALKAGYSAAATQAKKAISSLSPDLKAKFFVDENLSDEALLEFIGKQMNQLEPTELVMFIEQINPTALNKSKVKMAIEDIKNSIDDNLEKPFEAGADGTLEHIRRMEAASDALINNEQPRMLEQSSVPVVVKENRPVAYDVYLNPKDIIFDAETFQFKTGGDARGVKDTLAKVKQWDRDAAGSLMVFQREDGTYVIADGHQRLGLAKRLQAADPDANITINATVRREVDGFTAEEVMGEAMIRNVQQGTADAVDVARALRVDPNYITRMANKVAPNSSLYRYSTALYKLSDDAWGYYLNSGMNARLAAAVGNLVDDPALHLSVIKILEKTRPASDIEMRTQIDSILQAGSRDVTTIDMFGTTTIKESLIVERGKVMKASLDKLKKDKTVMSTLIQNEARIIEDGKNKLDTSYNRTQEEQNAVAIYQIETLANRKGDISDALTRSAKLWADGNKREATETFIEAIRGAIERGDTKGISASGDRRSAVVEGSSSKISEEPSPTVERQSLENFDDPNNLNVNQRNADQELAAFSDELEISSNNPELVNGGAINTSPTVKSPETLIQEDLIGLQATGAEPSSTVFASANTTPLSRIDDTISIGDFNSVFKRVIVQPTKDVNELMQLANQYKPDLEATLNNIVIDIDNVKVEVRTKELAKVKNKIAKKERTDQGDATTIPDYLGGRITVESMEDVTKVFKRIQEMDVKLVDVENYFALKDRSSGYKAIHLQMVAKDGFTMEVQIHHKDMLKAFENGRAYRKYKEKLFLTKEEELDRAKLEVEDKKDFDATYAAIKEREGIMDNVDDLEIVVGERVVGDEMENITTTYKQFVDDIENDKAIVGELVTRSCV